MRRQGLLGLVSKARRRPANVNIAICVRCPLSWATVDEVNDGRSSLRCACALSFGEGAFDPVARCKAPVTYAGKCSRVGAKGLMRPLFHSIAL